MEPSSRGRSITIMSLARDRLPSLAFPCKTGPPSRSRPSTSHTIDQLYIKGGLFVDLKRKTRKKRSLPASRSSTILRPRGMTFISGPETKRRICFLLTLIAGGCVNADDVWVGAIISTSTPYFLPSRAIRCTVRASPCLARLFVSSIAVVPWTQGG